MLFLFIVFLLFIAFCFSLYTNRDRAFLSKSVLALTLFSLLATISLAQNYTQSLIPEANDGIGISNPLAYWIITEDQWVRQWSQELFKSFYEYSTMITLYLLLMYCIVVVIESKKNSKG